MKKGKILYTVYILYWKPAVYQKRTLSILAGRFAVPCMDLFLRAMSQAAVLARTVGECRKGQIPRPLGRCKLDTPLLAAGSLIILEEAGFFGTMVDADESYPYMVETLIRPLKNEYGGEDR